MLAARAWQRPTLFAWLVPVTLTLLVLSGASSWSTGAFARRADSTPNAATSAPKGATVVDSALGLEEALRRFRAGLPVAAQLSGGARSREGLVREFVRTVVARDTATVRRLVLSRSEFAYLYYPHSPFTREPHKQAADLVWFFTQANSSKGITRVFDRLGGQDLAYGGHRCAKHGRRQGPNLLWEDCTVRLTDANSTGDVRLFGSIIERAGRFKFVSYATDY